MLLGYEGLGADFCIFCLYSIIWFISCACVVIRLKYVRVAGSNGMLVRGFWTECVWMGCVEDVGLIGLGFIYVSCTSVICTRNPFGRFWMGSAYSLCMIRSMQHFS